MKKFKTVLSLLMISTILVLPNAISAQAEEVVDNINEIETYNTSKFGNAHITGDGVNIRRNSTLSSTVIGQLYKGDGVKILDEAYGSGLRWYYVELKSGTRGYVAAQYVSYN
ncbi:MAG: SH3 domain-containing protein [Lachnospiraceae bacterium]|nr:SH3 domain-containing protein [Lachnospiraceae bacterium]